MESSGLRESAGWRVGILTAIAVFVGLGAAHGRGASVLPTAFELRDERVLSVMGVHEGRVEFGRMRRVHRPPGPYGYGGGTYQVFQTLGTGELSLEVTQQKGARLAITAMAVRGAPYGEEGEAATSERAAGSGSDALAPGRRSSARLRWRGGDWVQWASSTALRGGTRVRLNGRVALTSPYYGDFSFEGKTGVSGGATRAMTGGRASARMRGFSVELGGGRLYGEIAWTTEDRGVVTFTAPEFLVGTSGTIRRLSSGVFVVTGPRGYGVRMRFDDAGVGTCSLGIGTFRLSGGYDGAFQLHFE